MNETKKIEVLHYPTIGGYYKHYKGGIYKFLHMATHTETQEPLCIYQSVLYGSYHARPLSSWNESLRLSREEMIKSGIRSTSISRFTPTNYDGQV